MMKLFLAAVAAVALVSLTGCGSPCGDLEETCGKCPADAAQLKAGCDIVVAADDDDACQAAIDAKSYDAVCK